MKQKFLLKTMLLLCAIVGGVNSAWAEETATLQISSSVTSQGNLTDNKSNTWAFTTDGALTGNNSYIQAGTNKTDVSYIRLSTSAFSTKRIKKVQVWGTAKANTGVSAKVKIGDTIIGTSTVYSVQNASSGGTEYSVNNTNNLSGDLTIEISRGSAETGAIYFNKAIVTYEDTHTLTYSATNGSITGVDAGSNAVASGASVAKDATVTLTATPSSGYEFSSWEVSGTGSSLSSTSTNPTTFTMGTADATVTANFIASGATPTYTLTITDPTGGTITVLDDEANDVSSGDKFEEGTELTLEASASTGYTFSAWTGTTSAYASTSSANTTFTMPASASTIGATFTVNTHSLSITSSNGTCVTTVNGETWDGSSKIPFGAAVVSTATPNSGYLFSSWSCSYNTVTTNDNEISFTMPDADVTLTANYSAIPTHTATFNVNGATSSNTFYEGQTISFPADPADISGKTFIGWLKNSTITGTTNEAPSTVDKSNETMDNSDVTYYAVFADVTGTTYASWTATELGSLTSSDIFVIVGNNGATYALPSADASSAPSAISIGISEGKIDETGGAVADNLKWNISGNSTDGYTFYPNGSTTKYLYILNNNDGVRVGKPNANTTEEHALTVTDGYLTAGFSSARYIGIYNSSNWRCYTSKTGQSNIANQTFAFYKYTAGSTTYSNYCTTVVVTYSVTYDGNGATSGSVPEDNTAYTSGQSVTVAGNTGNLAKTGYAFDGWNTQNDGQGTNYAANETFSITANTTLYAKWNEKTITGLSYTGTPAKTTYYAGESFDPTGLTVNVNYDGGSSDDVTASVTWTPDPLTAGTTSVTGTYSGQTVNVSGLTVTAAPGTEANPYTVAQALNAINALDNNGTIDDKYVIGKVSTAGTSLSSGKMTYSISVDGTTTNQLQVYQGKSLGNGDFSAVTDLEVGDEVVVFGQLKKYVSGTKTTPEFNSGNYLISHSPKPASNLSKTSDITLDYKNADTMAHLTDYYTTSSDGEISYTIGDGTVIERDEEIISALKVGETTVTVSQAATLSYKAGEITINVTVQDTREPATTIPGINISTLTVDAENGTISVVDPVKADEGVTFSFASSNEDVLLIDGTDYVVGEIGTATVTVTATPSDANLYTPVEAEFTVTVEAASKTDTDIVLHEESGSTVYGTPLVVEYAITDGYDGEMSYTIANPAIADVAIGVDAITFTPKAVGSTTITISAPATPSFNEADDVTFTLTVTAPIGGTEAYVSSATTASLSFASNDNWKLPTSSYVKTSASYSDGTYTISLSAGTAGDGWKWSQDATNGNYLIMGKTGVSLTLPAFDKAVTQIDVVGKTGASGYVVQNIYVGNTAVSTATTGATGTNEYAINENYQAAGTIYTLKVTSNHNTQITSIVVHFAANPITVTLAATGYATYCSPYPLDFSGNDHSKYRAWYVSNIDNNTVTFSEVTGLVKGGTPIILYGTPSAKCELASADSDNELDGNKLVGTLAPTWVGQESNGNINYALTTYGDFRKISTSGIVFPANKVYLPVPKAVAQGRSQLSIMFYDETTGISSMEDGRWLMNNAVYDLQGRRVETPRKGSLYILNGKKVVY